MEVLNVSISIVYARTCSPLQDANVKLIRELRTEIQRLKSIITAAKLDPDCDLKGTESAMEYIHKNEEMVCICTYVQSCVM